MLCKKEIKQTELKEALLAGWLPLGLIAQLPVRAVQRYHRGHGFKSRSSLKFNPPPGPGRL